jgi:hypothetical protein
VPLALIAIWNWATQQHLKILHHPKELFPQGLIQVWALHQRLVPHQRLDK